MTAKAISNCVDSFNWIKLRCCVHRRVKIKVGFATAVSQSSVFIGPERSERRAGGAVGLRAARRYAHRPDVAAGRRTPHHSCPTADRRDASPSRYNAIASPQRGPTCRPTVTAPRRLVALLLDCTVPKDLCVIRTW